MAVTPSKVVKIVLLPFVILLAIELFLQLGALILAASVRDKPTGWSTENTHVLALGDSNTFGIYLEEDESYPSQLEKLWNERHPDNLIEVLNLGYPGTHSFVVANSIDEVIKTFTPDVVLLTIGVNDMFTASEYVEADPDTAEHIDLLNPLALLRRYSRLYKLVYMAKQGGETTYISVAGTNDQMTNLAAAPIKEREDLKWSDNFEERMRNWSAFNETNRDASDNPAGLRKPVTYPGEKSPTDSTEKNAAMLPTKLDPLASKTEYGYQYLHKNIASIQRRVELGGAVFYLLDYAASETFYLPVNEVVRSYRDKNVDTRFIDVAKEFRKVCPVSRQCMDLFLPDFHPTKKGYQMVASLVANTFEKDATISK